MLSFGELMERMLNRVPNDVDKREGSIIWDALAPCAAELVQLYIELEEWMKLVFIDTSQGSYLTRKCNEMGVDREKATCAVRKATIVSTNIVGNGSRFTIDDLVFSVIENTDINVYSVKCETAGEVGNKPYGKLVPVEYIEGVTSAELQDVLIPGEEEETDEELKARYFEYVHEPAFGGNVADYKRKVKALDGVGQVKVFPVWNGAGTVKLVLLDSDLNPPSNTLVTEVATAISPTNDDKGFGIAPIGHTVTVLGATQEDININTEITVLSTVNQTTMTSTIKKTIEDYLLSLRETWEDLDTITVRIARIESKMLDLPGVIDITNTTLNSSTSNLTIQSESVPTLGNVVITYATS